MKKYFKLLGLVLIILLFSGCSNDSMDNITIYTSVYPIEFVTKSLYKDHSKIYNIYPQGINPYEYKLTDKQISDYSDSSLIIYNGLSDEKKYVVKMINKNKKLKLIDATNNIEVTNGLDEVWINPSNVLMILQNVKEGLKEYVNSSIINDEIDEKYEELKIKLSSIDAELKEMAENAEDKNIIVQNDELTFLNKYGLNVVSIDEKSITDKIYNDTESLLNEGNVNYIYLLNGEKENETTKKFKQEFSNIKVLYIDPINNISTQDKNEGFDYISLMNNNIDKLKQELFE